MLPLIQIEPQDISIGRCCLQFGRFQFGDSSDNLVPMDPGYPAVLEDEGAVTVIAALMASSAGAKAESMGQAQPEQNVCDDAESSGEC
jgi:hypothetical protein